MFGIFRESKKEVEQQMNKKKKIFHIMNLSTKTKGFTQEFTYYLISHV